MVLKKSFLLVFIGINLVCTKGLTAVLSEGWYKIVSGGQHVGFVVLRTEFNESKKQFVSTSFTQTSPMAGDLKESLVATSNEKMEPVSYQYTSTVGKLVKTIDASFAKDVMTAKVTEADKTESVQNKLQKGTFLSQFLVYVILQNKAGLKVGNNFAYSAVAEEDAKASNGEAFINGTEKVAGVDTFKILNTFKGTRYINYVTPKGVILMTKSPTQSLSTELVGNSDEATKGFDVNRKTLTLLFKTLPVATLPAGTSAASAGAASEPAPTEIPAGNLSPEKMKQLGTPTTLALPKGAEIPPGKGKTK